MGFIDLLKEDPVLLLTLPAVKLDRKQSDDLFDNFHASYRQGIGPAENRRQQLDFLKKHKDILCKALIGAAKENPEAMLPFLATVNDEESLLFEVFGQTQSKTWYKTFDKVRSIDLSQRNHGHLQTSN